MAGEKKGWAKRLQPLVGALIFALGLTTVGLLVQRGLDSKALASVGMGGMMGLGGLGLIFRAGVPRGIATLYAAAAIVVAGIVVFLAMN